jgi:putative NADH-flavin reductase
VRGNKSKEGDSRDSVNGDRASLLEFLAVASFSTEPMRVIILGGTGPSGILLIKESLAAKHTVVVYARSPQKLPERLREHPDVTIVKGELEDAQALDAAFAGGGVDAVLSALGPTFGNPSGTPIARGYAVVIEAMRRAGVKRLIALGTVSIKDDAHDAYSVVYATMVTGVWLGARSAYKDIVAVGEVIRASQDIDWTIVRVPVLKNDENRVVRAGYVGDGVAGAAYTLSRRGFAVFVVQELEKGEWIKKAPLITSA